MATIIKFSHFRNRRDYLFKYEILLEQRIWPTLIFGKQITDSFMGMGYFCCIYLYIRG